MKQKLSVAVFSISIILIIIATSGCYYFKYQMLYYYQDDSNYVTVEGYYCGNGTYENCILIKYMTYENEEAIIDFQLEPQSRQTLQDNGFFEEVQENSGITFTTAFEMFSAGYIYPVVEIWSNGKCYLDFNTGKANLLASFK